MKKQNVHIVSGESLKSGSKNNKVSQTPLYDINWQVKLADILSSNSRKAVNAATNSTNTSFSNGSNSRMYCFIYIYFHLMHACKLSGNVFGSLTKRTDDFK